MYWALPIYSAVYYVEYVLTSSGYGLDGLALLALSCFLDNMGHQSSAYFNEYLKHAANSNIY